MNRTIAFTIGLFIATAASAGDVCKHTWQKVTAPVKECQTALNSACETELDRRLAWADERMNHSGRCPDDLIIMRAGVSSTELCRLAAAFFNEQAVTLKPVMSKVVSTRRELQWTTPMRNSFVTIGKAGVGVQSLGNTLKWMRGKIREDEALKYVRQKVSEMHPGSTCSVKTKTALRFLKNTVKRHARNILAGTISGVLNGPSEKLVVLGALRTVAKVSGSTAGD